MNILENIIAEKKREVEEKSSLFPVKLLEKSAYFNSPVVSMKKYLTRKDKSGIIGEIKRKSPSKGMLNKYVSVEKTSIGYMQAGCSALSVLTDEKFFGGKNEDLTTARQFNYCPILRKDFLINEYQIIEARSIGADAILLIAAVLSKEEIQRLSLFAKSLGLEIILEIHSEAELNKISDHVDIVGVNNRNLETFETNLSTSTALLPLIPSEFLKISESGIHSPEDAYKLKDAGFDGLLIGEQFMRSSNPGQVCAKFIQQLNLLYAGESLRAENTV